MSFLKDKGSLELWGGFECTVNRVGNNFFDQSEWNGHARRIRDLDLVAGLGIKTIRYPVLWEHTAPESLEKFDWAQQDERLSRLQELGIQPIVGLVHHGSGPAYTDLLDPAFPEKLAIYARAVAERYPWIEAYTPVNEPLTTARFSGLYGHWYPHHTNNESFLKALLNECRATVLAMQAIREVNPGACLVQTEDLGKIHSTPGLSYQAELENNRRWLSFDLLCGRVDNRHPLWNYLLEDCKVSPADLAWFSENPFPPDIFGINYYLSSERFLDERMHYYPAEYHGGNKQQSYADVEAVRVLGNGLAGYKTILAEVWERYHKPIAVTEVHNGCTREEQMRWLVHAWQNCEQLRQKGVDIKALTVWALIGLYDWNKLVTQPRGFYEPGVFDLRGPQPRPTALSKVVQELATGKVPHHPTLGAPGWWERPERFIYGCVSGENSRASRLQPQPLNQKLVKDRTWQPVLITGATGTLGQAFIRLCELRGLPYVALNRQELDITNPQAVKQTLRYWRPWAVVNAAGFVRVDQAEDEPVKCLQENTCGPMNLAAECVQEGVRLLVFSSDLVFNGRTSSPYLESSPACPLNVYGRSKCEAEQQVLQIMPGALVVRTSAFFGPWDQYNFVTNALQSLLAGQTFVASQDNIVSPTYVPDLGHACLDLLIDGESGLWHLANQGEVSWFELAQRAAELAKVEVRKLQPCASQELTGKAKRPQYSVLDSERGRLLPSLDNALERYIRECEQLSWENLGQAARSA